MLEGETGRGEARVSPDSGNLPFEPAATAACGGPITYNVYLSGNPVFTPDNSNRLASHVTGTSYLDLRPAGSDNFPLYYIVRAVDSANGLEEGSLVMRGATPTGPATYLLNETFEEPGGFDGPGWTHVSYTPPSGGDLSTAPSLTATPTDTPAAGHGATARSVR